MTYPVYFISKFFACEYVQDISFRNDFALLNSESLKRVSKFFTTELIANHIRANSSTEDLFLFVPCTNYYDIFRFISLIQLFRFRGIRVFPILLFLTDKFAKQAAIRAARDNISGLLYFQTFFRIEADFLNNLSRYGSVGILTSQELHINSIDSIEQLKALSGFIYHFNGGDDCSGEMTWWKGVTINTVSHIVEELRTLNNQPIVRPHLPEVNSFRMVNNSWLNVMQLNGKVISISHQVLDDWALERQLPIMSSRQLCTPKTFKVFPQNFNKYTGFAL